MTRSWLPAALLAAYALAFGWRALDGGVLAYDDHPGQLYRVAHVLDLGPWPWRFNPGWWAGYAELQYYPPGFAYAGAALTALSLGAIRVDAAYQAVLWLTFLLPGALVYALLLRVLGNAWLALPGGFVALSLCADSRSGVEEGLRWGLVAARLAWGLLPGLALALVGWTERERPPIAAAIILAAVIVTHPSHAPAGLLLVLLAAARGPGGRARRLRHAALLCAAALALSAFWLVPLLAHLDMALPLAWADASLGGLARRFVARPFLLCLLVASALALGAPTAPRARWLVWLAPAMAGAIVVDAAVAQPLGIMWLPADRLLDSFLLALILGASIALAEASRRLRRLPDWALAALAIALSVVLAQPGRSEPTMALWPRPRPTAWPTQQAVVAGNRLDQLWQALAATPSGRVLFVRSSAPLVHGREWWRPHSHITGLTPLRAGRDIVNGTFTHPSPVAGLVYTGAADNRPITRLVEQRDGASLFGRPLGDLNTGEFNRLAEALGISSVVALDEDEGRLAFVADNPAFGPPARIGPFLVFGARAPRATAERTALQRWRLRVDEGSGAWIPTGLAYSPLWRARAASGPLDVRRDRFGMAEVRRGPPGTTEITLVHAPGIAEWAGLALTGVAVLGLAGWRARTRPRSQSPATAAGVRPAGRS